ncbi:MULTISPECIES: hypothetical protein [Crocosphaera]|uniref:Uncharacterized protein n=4 Tax=Crocosphaera watsonii TaxID=263511 RepID=G5J0W0_CROWT|nr:MULTISPECIES: hypothetical protein [Crocosphaera]EHJ14177.1 hypothetical protein CWATWH0003_1150 [Crocosphaera watsonii WH 0003]CCQ50931.1 hypothetical protein CWATWH8502_239 [Crocosphaera watsonii WH 8502]CCQ55555.1 hypothetical protein CWATWH0005_1391 [Crocosphaera watsonii WH 0005]CCQ62309.1 hypothetical protein CWATWH0401_2152 [Crocosphaera watsonii WH 0401]
MSESKNSTIAFTTQDLEDYLDYKVDVATVKGLTKCWQKSLSINY